MGTTHRVTLIPGDGVGPELTEATRRVLEAAVATAGSSFDWDVRQAGRRHHGERGHASTGGDPRVGATQQDRESGPITTPIGTGFRSVNVALRGELELYVVPAAVQDVPRHATFFTDPGVDVVIVRENTEDLYAGIEYESGTPEADGVIDYLNGLQKKQIRAKSGISIKPMSEFGSERSSATRSSTRRTTAASGCTASPRATS
jgi:isocitrate dehydrogenase (NAD+)